MCLKIIKWALYKSIQFTAVEVEVEEGNVEVKNEVLVKEVEEIEAGEDIVKVKKDVKLKEEVIKLKGDVEEVLVLVEKVETTMEDEEELMMLVEVDEEVLRAEKGFGEVIKEVEVRKLWSNINMWRLKRRLWR